MDVKTINLLSNVLVKTIEDMNKEKDPEKLFEMLLDGYSKLDFCYSSRLKEIQKGK